MNQPAGKTAIVTGGAICIGHACVQRMAEDGAQVATFDVLEAEGKALAVNPIHRAGIWTPMVENHLPATAPIWRQQRPEPGAPIPSAPWERTMTSPGRWGGWPRMRPNS